MTFGSGGGFTKILKTTFSFSAVGTYTVYTCPANTITRIRLEWVKKFSVGAMNYIIKIKSNYDSGATDLTVIPSTATFDGYIPIPAQIISSTGSGGGGPLYIPADTTPSELFTTGHYDPSSQQLILGPGEQLTATFSGVPTTTGNLQFTIMESST